MTDFAGFVAYVITVYTALLYGDYLAHRRRVVDHYRTRAAALATLTRKAAT